MTTAATTLPRDRVARAIRTLFAIQLVATNERPMTVASVTIDNPTARRPNTA